MPARRADTRIYRNDYSALTPPELGRWEPDLTVSVIIAARGGQHALDLALAALAEQTYPAELLDVVVVDDHSAPALRLPTLRPRRCRIERAPDGGRGTGHARAYGAHITSGDIICWLDSDMVTDRHHIEAHARWQHVHPDCVSLGRVRFARRGPEDPAELAVLARSGRLGTTFADAPGHEWVERVLTRSEDLKAADHLGFQAYVGSSAAVRRSLYEAVGGVNPALDLGQDTEFGYRLWQAGGVFVPERQAQGWHVGDATPARTRIPSDRFRSTVLTAPMPHPRTYRERTPHRMWRVPLVQAVVDVAGARFETVRACVDRLLTGAERDLAVTLVGDWDGCAASGTEDDSWLELRLIQAGYLADARVGFETVRPRTGFPSPYLLEVPVLRGVGTDTVARLAARAERAKAGLTELTPERGDDDAPGGLRLWRTRALARALRAAEPGEDIAALVGRLHGTYRLRAAEEDLVDLRSMSAEELQTAPWPPPEPGRPVPRVRTGSSPRRAPRGRTGSTPAVRRTPRTRRGTVLALLFAPLRFVLRPLARLLRR
ncbi:GT2 family glycosyltransferase [Murinocardiopsis flavida]|uniref:GT2 family glycosyltransferase n=1 Tax=Murinocardiopsis flavida TaxID=645275 RepID=A0A2P8DL93_9ACTN|nr:glycosyltransferase family 2 protein [Murinocardiopsis flavida]PSK97997.1 GT2 family glycosyltransferase [Murinocardiopsis flavida]